VTCVAITYNGIPNLVLGMMGYSKPNFGRVGGDVKNYFFKKKLRDPKPIIHKQAMVFFF
jgi:hypothetical protein